MHAWSFQDDWIKRILNYCLFLETPQTYAGEILLVAVSYISRNRNFRALFHCSSIVFIPSRHTTPFQRLKDVYTTSATSCRRLIDVETTSCVCLGSCKEIRLFEKKFKIHNWKVSGILQWKYFGKLKITKIIYF